MDPVSTYNQNLVTQAMAQNQQQKLSAFSQVKPHTMSAREAKTAAQDFEAMFIGQMLKPMFENLNQDEWIGTASESNEIWRDLLVQEYGKSIAKNGGIGVADAVERTLLKTQEVVQ